MFFLFEFYKKLRLYFEGDLSYRKEFLRKTFSTLNPSKITNRRIYKKFNYLAN